MATLKKNTLAWKSNLWF